MKKELLEYLIRVCVREVLDQSGKNEKKPANLSSFHKDEQGVWCKECGSSGKVIKYMGERVYICINNKCKSSHPRLDEVDEPDKKGIPDSPEGGLGTGGNLDIPKDTGPEKPAEPEASKAAPTNGIYFINPKDKTRFTKMEVSFKDTDRTIEQKLHSIGVKTMGGKQIFIPSRTMNAIKKIAGITSATLFLYLKKYTPESGEIYLESDASTQAIEDDAENNFLGPEDFSGSIGTLRDPSVAPIGLNPFQATDPDDLGQQADADVQNVATNLDRPSPYKTAPRYSDDWDADARADIDEQLKSVIKKMVKKIIK